MLPFISVLTPTYNRRRFLANAIACYESQTYPKDRMEWVILDDGLDDVSDVFEELSKRLPNIRYNRQSERSLIGAKRNELHKLARGEILVSWDDDDFYPPERVSHAVEKLEESPEVHVAGCSLIYIYFSDVKLIHRLGPFSQRHATNGTMAVRREFATTHFYDETVSHGEEESFLNFFSYPMIQLSPLKVMLVMSHNSNTFEKGQLRDNPRALSARTELKLEHFIKDAKLRVDFEDVATAFATGAQKENTMAGLAELAEAAKAKKLALQQAKDNENREIVEKEAQFQKNQQTSIDRIQALRKIQNPTIMVLPNAQSYAMTVVKMIQAQFPMAIIYTAKTTHADIVISHITEVDTADINPLSILVVISGESWEQKKRADVCIGPTRSANAGSLIFYPFAHSSLEERRRPFPVKPPGFSERSKYCAFMYNAHCQYRNKIFEELQSKCGSDKFIALGTQCNPGVTQTSRYVYNENETYNDIAVSTYTAFKFVLAIENSWVDGYFTEKIINPIAAGSVPLYWGHPGVFEYINKARVIYIPDYPTNADLANFIGAMSQNQWEAIVAAPWYNEKGKPDVVQKQLSDDIQRCFGASAVVSIDASEPALVIPGELLADLPPIYYINLDRRPDRLEHMEKMCKQYKVPSVTRTTAIDGEKVTNYLYQAPRIFKGHEITGVDWDTSILNRMTPLKWTEVACLVSHLRAIREWLESSKTPMALICEDDLSLETTTSWGCNWQEISTALGAAKMPDGSDWDTIQAALTYMPGHSNVISLHPRGNEDHCACAYFIRRGYAERLMATYWNDPLRRWSFTPRIYRQTSEEVVYRDGKCLSIPLFTYLNTGSDIQTKDHADALHIYSRNVALDVWKRESAMSLLQMGPEKHA